MEETVYKNIDLINSKDESFNQFSDRLILPEIDDYWLAKLEWALMLLSYKDNDMYFSESFKKYYLKKFDGAWLINAKKIGDDNIICLMDKTDLKESFDFIKKCDVKVFSLTDYASLTRTKLLENKEIRNLSVKGRYNFETAYSYFDNKNEKWYMANHGFRLAEMHNILSLTNLTEKISNILQEKLKETKSNKESIRLNDDFNKIVFDLINDSDIKFTYPYPEYISLKSNYIMNKSIIREYLKTNITSYLDSIKNLYLSISLNITSYFEWFIYIKENANSIGVKIPINPESSKEIFQFRDIPEGSKRKKAICNFVKQHYRTVKTKNTSIEHKKTLIKKHLRGETKFKWRGLEVNIIPSLDDINLLNPNKKFKQLK